MLVSKPRPILSVWSSLYRMRVALRLKPEPTLPLRQMLGTSAPDFALVRAVKRETKCVKSMRK